MYLYIEAMPGLCMWGLAGLAEAWEFTAFVMLAYPSTCVCVARSCVPSIGLWCSARIHCVGHDAVEDGGVHDERLAGRLPSHEAQRHVHVFDTVRCAKWLLAAGAGPGDRLAVQAAGWLRIRQGEVCVDSGVVAQRCPVHCVRSCKYSSLQ